MAKTVFVIWDDFYHPAKTYADIVGKIFKNNEWELTITRDARDLFKPERAPDLTVNLSLGRPEGADELNRAERERLKAMTEKGMGMLYIHAGMAYIDEASPVFEIARGRFLHHPEPHNPVYVGAVPGIKHPILEGFVPFEEPDEHYFCKVDMERTQPFLYSASKCGTEIAGWAHSLGEGRVCGLTPGHTEPMLAKMERLVKNAADWCARRI